MTHLLGGLLAFVCGGGCSPDSPRPNLIVIVIDTLRPDHLELYGYERPTAPFLARLGGESAVFLNAFSSSSWTAPATASLFTGQYPVRHGVTRGFHAAKERVREVEREGHSVLALNRMPRTTATLPERLRSRGYATFGLATNPNTGHEIGFDRGFDRFERLKTNSAELVFDRLLEWESIIKERTPYFIYVHLNDTHPPWGYRRLWSRPT